MIQINNVSKVYGRNAAVHALKEISLAVSPGEIIVIQKPSGFGIR